MHMYIDKSIYYSLSLQKIIKVVVPEMFYNDYYKIWIMKINEHKFQTISIHLYIKKNNQYDYSL